MEKDLQYLEKPREVTSADRAALARMYADSGFREYLVNIMRGANHNAMIYLENGKVDEAKACASRFTVMKDLLEKGKEHYVNIEKINKVTLKHGN